MEKIMQVISKNLKKHGDKTQKKHLIYPSAEIKIGRCFVMEGGGLTCIYAW